VRFTKTKPKAGELDSLHVMLITHTHTEREREIYIYMANVVSALVKPHPFCARESRVMESVFLRIGGTPLKING